MLTVNRPKASREYERLRKAACAALVEKDWSLRRAAVLLGRTHYHLHLVLAGKRISEPLLVRVLELPRSPIKRSHSGFARKTHRPKCT